MADIYRYVVGVDTDADTHNYAIVRAPNGALIDQATFPTTPVGLRPARDWSGRRTGGDLDGVLVAAEGTGSYGAVLGDVLEATAYRVVEAPTPRRERGHGKTDELDAALAARSALVLEMTKLRDRRAGEAHTALQVLTGARDHLNVEQLRSINALTALVRGLDLGADARRASTTEQISTIAAWRRREEDLGPRRLAPCPSDSSFGSSRWTSSLLRTGRQLVSLPPRRPVCLSRPASVRSPPP